MRNASIAVLREIGVETGGSNVQFAVNPKDGRLIVIEMNPRVSRSSALASKATGFPIAKVAAKLAVGYTLDEITNDITGATPGELRADDRLCRHQDPALRVREVQGRRAVLGTAMKSVGEVMAIGRNIHESAAEGAARAGDRAVRASTSSIALVGAPRDEIEAALAVRDARPAAGRGAGAARGLHRRRGPRDRQIRSVVPRADRRDRRGGERGAGERPAARRGGHAAAEGDGVQRQAARLSGAAHRRACATAIGARRADPRGGQGDDRRRQRGRGARAAPQARRAPGVQADRHLRGGVRRQDAVHVFDLRGAELRRARVRERSRPTRRKIVILGGGPNRIGQGIEFDYCCCHACFALADAGLRDDHGQLQSGDGVAPTTTRPTGCISSR